MAVVNHQPNNMSKEPIATESVATAPIATVSIETVSLATDPAATTSIATIFDNMEERLTVHGATQLKNLHMRIRRFQQCNSYDKFAPCRCVEVHSNIEVNKSKHRNLQTAFVTHVRGFCVSIYL